MNVVAEHVFAPLAQSPRSLTHLGRFIITFDDIRLPQRENKTQYYIWFTKKSII